MILSIIGGNQKIFDRMLKSEGFLTCLVVTMVVSDIGGWHAILYSI